MLDAGLTTVTGKDDFVIRRLDLIAPLVRGQRYRVLIATHRAEYYPLQIEADCFRPECRTVTTPGLMGVPSAFFGPQNRVEDLTWPPESDWRAIAWNQNELLEKIGRVRGSGEVRSAIKSFVARSNELKLVSPVTDSVQPQSAA